MLPFLQQWLKNPNRVPLLRWTAGFFTAGTVIILITALRYFSAYQISPHPLGMIYTIAAYISHFSSALLILALVPVALTAVLLPVRTVIYMLSIVIMAFMLSLVLIDSQLYIAHRFHITLLTIRIMGIQTWGFALFYFLLGLIFFSFLAKIIGNYAVKNQKKVRPLISITVIALTTIFTHRAHIWADVNGYVPITRFTTTLPFFYPATDRHRQIEKGIDINKRHLGTLDIKTQAGFQYPLKPLEFSSGDSSLNLLFIMADGLRFDVMTDEYAPNCMKFVGNHGMQFTNHWSGGNSTQMGMFSLFYGLPSNYQPHVQANRISPVLINRLLEEKFQMGIFSSNRITVPAAMDLTVFTAIPNLRCETKIPGPPDPWRNDSAITDDWKAWLDNRDTTRPFFGFLFYDAMLHQKHPPSYNNRLPVPKNANNLQRDFIHYKITMLYIDSLIGLVLDDLTARNLFNNTVIIITADHGVEFDENNLGFVGHGSSYSEYQLRVPFLLLWPGKSTGVTIDKRTSHCDICLTLMHDLLGCTNATNDYSSGINLFSSQQWNWFVAASYYNNAIVEPERVTIQFQAGYFEVRDRRYQPIAAKSFSPAIHEAFLEMRRFFSR